MAKNVLVGHGNMMAKLISEWQRVSKQKILPLEKFISDQNGAERCIDATPDGRANFHKMREPSFGDLDHFQVNSLLFKIFFYCRSKSMEKY